MRPIRRAAGVALRVLGVALVAALALEAAWPPVYRYPPPRPFAGERWYDPYAGFDGPWLRANFHTHSGAWGGVSDGGGEAAEVVAHYEALGYDVPGLSNYMTIGPSLVRTGVHVTAYEHGFGLGKVHQTVVGAERVCWLEFPLVTMRRHKQRLIDALAETAPVVVLNHPAMRGSYSEADLERLVGYQGLEISSKYVHDTGPWDAALSAGRPVWGFASDDGHHVLERDSHSGIGWLWIGAAERTRDAVVAALRAGRFAAVRDRRKRGSLRLESCGLDDDGALAIALDRPADEIRFVGQGGAVLATATGTRTASYRPRAEDTYVRAEARLGESVLYTNPVFRHAGDPLAHPRPEVRPTATWLVRVGVAVLAIAALRVLIAGGKRRADPLAGSS